MALALAVEMCKKKAYQNDDHLKSYFHSVFLIYIKSTIISCTLLFLIFDWKS